MNINQHKQVIKNKLDRPVVLVGMMGAGKTHVGRMLAKTLELEFRDTDALIEEKAGCSIAEIFKRDGEEKFRAAEEETIAELIHEKPQVISTGGGAPVNPRTLERIKSEAIGIWIQADMDEMLKRVRSNTNRPLLKTGNPEKTLRDILSIREEFYAQVPIQVKNRDGKAEKTISSILEGLDKTLQ